MRLPTLSVLALLALSVTADAQTAVSIVPRAECSATVGADVSTRPTGDRWTLEILVNNVVVARRNRAPFSTSLKGGPAQYVIDMRWVLDGQPTKPLDRTTVLCHAPGVTTTPVVVTPPPPPPPPTTVAPQISSFNASASVTSPITLGQTVTFSWSGITGSPVPALSLAGPNAPGTVTTSPVMVQPATAGDHLYTFRASNGVAPDATRSWTVRVNPATTPPPPPPPPPPSGLITWGAVTDVELGECSAAIHDQYMAQPPIADGHQYRTWHPKRDPSGCYYGHEHGAELRVSPTGSGLPTQPFLFGYVARRMQSAAEPLGHAEAHNGYKQFRIVLNQPNDEGRNSLMYQDSLFHMGTGSPRRMTIPHHTGQQRYYHPSEGLRANVQAMMDTGGVASVCDPRGAPSKDGFTIPRVGAGGVPCVNPLLVQSGYEIWTARRTLYALINGVRTDVYTAFATPAVFDPITVFKIDEPTRLIFAWDDIFKPFRQFPTDDWTGNKGCERESYAQPGIFRASGLPADANGLAVIWTTPMGEPSTSADPLAVRQEFTRTTNTDARGSTIQQGSNELKGNHAFKLRVSECGDATTKSKLRLSN